MHTVWQSYLSDHHAVIENNCVQHFGDFPAELQAARAAAIMTDLSPMGLIQFSGEDAKSFLQSQLTCDIRELDSGCAQYGSYCTPKGRILTSFLLWQHHDGIWMQLPANLLTAIQKRLSLYVLRAKVKLTDISDTWIRIGIAGPDAEKLLQTITGPADRSGQPLYVHHTEKFSAIYLPQNRIEITVSLEYAPVLWKQLKQHLTPVGTGCWDWLTIQSGIPVILPETQETFLPQMINLDAIGGVSFKKGCYPGQEIVARTQYLGKLKRRMFLAHIATAETIKPGDALYSADMEDQSSGNIVNAAPSPLGGYDALAVAQQSSIGNCDIHWQSLQGPVLEFKPLPYQLPE